MKKRSILLLLIITILMTFFSGCIGSKKEGIDNGVGVDVTRVDGVVSVYTNDDFVGGEYNIGKEVNPDTIKSSNGTLVISKKAEDGTTNVYVAVTGEELTKGSKIFEIRDNTDNLSISKKSVINEKNYGEQIKKASLNVRSSLVVRTAGQDILLGDFNNDNKVDLLDFVLFSDNYGGDVKYDIAPAVLGTASGWENIYSQKNSDGVVDILDLIIFAKNFGKSITPDFLITGLDSVKKGSQIQLSTTVSVTWQSLDTTIATVSPTTGMTTTITGVKEGTAVIKATSGTKSATFTVTVMPDDTPVITAITVTGESTVVAGKTIVLTSLVKYSNGTEKSEAVVWSSSNTAAATCDTTGITTTVTGVKEGTAVIKAEKEVNGVKVSTEKTITVTKAPDAGITIYVQKPTAWTDIYIWYDKDSTTAAWDTVGDPPSSVVNAKTEDYRTGWKKKVIGTSAGVEFLFNNGTWNSKLDKTGVTTSTTTQNFKCTTSVWVTNDGVMHTEDPQGPQKPTVTLDCTGGYFTPSKTVSIAIASDTDVLAKTYTINGVEKELTSNSIIFGADLVDGDKVTLSVSVTNAQGTTTVGPYTFTKGQSKVEKIAFVVPSKLGAQYTSSYTTFTLWSPDSSNVTVTIDGTTYTMDKVADFNGYTGVYGCTIGGNLENMEYQFKVNGKNIRDPYGKMVKYDPALADGAGTTYTENGATCSANTGSSVNIVMNMDKTKILWNARPELKEREDSIVYEINIRDFTIAANSGVTASKKGKYLGMVETGTTYGSVKTGIDHLKELGVTTVQIMPFYDFATKKNYSTGEIYNWGYDPVNFNVPEDRFSQNPGDYEARIKEVKTMIDEFHKNGIRVVMDVVYNHTFWNEMFMDITSKYYIYQNGKLANASGCGNGVDTGNAMVSRFIRDSLEYWLDEYNIDGFRFDLMGIYYYNEVNEWGKYLNSKYPDRNLIIYGEPWNGYWLDDADLGKRSLPGNRALMAQGRVGIFDGGFREAIKGGNDDATTGFMFNWQGTSKGGTIAQIKNGLRADIMDNKGYNAVGSGSYWMWEYKSTYDPEQQLNYISAHDNYCLWDKINYTLPAASSDYKKSINKFGMGIILTAQGIPFIHSGDEFLRTKTNGSFAAQGHNSYMWGDQLNQIDWSLKSTNAAVYNYYKDLIAIRRAHPGFRMTTWDEIYNNVTTSDSNGVVTQYIKASAKGDSWNEIKVIYNPGNDITVDSTGWTKVFDGNGATSATDGTCKGTAITIFKK